MGKVNDNTVCNSRKSIGRRKLEFLYHRHGKGHLLNNLFVASPKEQVLQISLICLDPVSITASSPRNYVMGGRSLVQEEAERQPDYSSQNDVELHFC